ncbi:MAG TPA: hypothetical protein VNY05_37510 [Candidatus Acidoferrales bacterium]|jgi:hypothetical protein|nr:hypothetical protein [Candidatus Acidoferrales bacterium]
MPSLISAVLKLISKPSRACRPTALDRTDAQLDLLIYDAFPQEKDG